MAEAHHSRLRCVPGCHVFNGKTVEGGGRIRQKGVDVLLAVQMLTHVFRKNAQRVTLLAGDADFAPLVRALVMEGAYVNILYARNSIAADLLEAADASSVLNAVLVLRYATREFQGRHPPPEIYDDGQG